MDDDRKAYLSKLQGVTTDADIRIVDDEREIRIMASWANGSSSKEEKEKEDFQKDTLENNKNLLSPE
ncbi:hypothetical protein L6452_44489 [Arctium lappa]|uniref:Uncharacterized protein n=1 Tax=Arctium lappa TaxID=4217 RepID=A0ACB8XG89_ARCLA|nr:hypothetical protein L6452_44489 [Arctium lappa]